MRFYKINIKFDAVNTKCLTFLLTFANALCRRNTNSWHIYQINAKSLQISRKPLQLVLYVYDWYFNWKIWSPNPGYLWRFEACNILDLGRFETSDIMRSGTFYIRAFLDLGHFATVTFCIGLLCLWTFCMGTFCRSIIY